MGRQVPDSDGSLAAAFGVALAVVTLVVASLAPVAVLSAAGCLAAGYLLAGVQSRSRGRTDARRRPAPGAR